MTPEEYYRSKYPKVNKLTHIDNEIIELLDNYASYCTNKLTDKTIEVMKLCEKIRDIEEEN